MFLEVFVGGLAVYLVAWYLGVFSGKKCLSSARLAGKTAVITGANTGIGYETAAEFVRRGVSTLIIGCRDMRKAESALQRLESLAGPSQTIYLFKLDLASLDSVRSFAANVKANDGVSEAGVHILVNNAGIFAGDGGPTKDGYEIHFGVNYLGHFLLTVLLEPELIKASKASNDQDGSSNDVRIVNVSSDGHKFTMLKGLDIDHLRFGYHDWQYDGYFKHHQHYGQSKLAQNFHAQTLNKKFAEKGFGNITAYSLHPGLVKTEIGRSHNEALGQTFAWLVDCLFFLFSRNAVEGAQTSLYCSLDQGAKTNAGQYFDDCTCKPMSPKLVDQRKMDLLWQKSLLMTDSKSCL